MKPSRNGPLTLSTRRGVGNDRAPASGQLPSSPRIPAVDAARGIAIAAMLIMNHPGSWDHTYRQLQHAEWHGWTLTDVVFPIFLFVVGVSMMLSFTKQGEQGADRARVMARASRRAIVLFALGLVLSTFPWWRFDPGHFRIPGVLQRIALSFLLATPVVLWLRVRAQAATALGFLLLYWILMRWVPVPGVGAGIWEPGLDLGAYIDMKILGLAHIWPGRNWDPLGLLGTLPAVSNVLFGVLAGHWIRTRRPEKEVAAGLALAGAAAIAIGLLWHFRFPINKNLWTSSYAVFATGWGLVLLAGCYWATEVRGQRLWSYPFAALGVNAILIYFLASLLELVSWRIPLGAGSLRSTIYGVLFEPWASPVNASLLFAITHLVGWVIVAMILERRGIRFKV